jgi:hypothetical protein
VNSKVIQAFIVSAHDGMPAQGSPQHTDKHHLTPAAKDDRLDT